MKRFSMRCGHFAYSVKASETFYLGGLGICDDCGARPGDGYLVPVLNHFQCPDCFNDFESRAKYYPEDVPFEEQMMRYWERVIPNVVK